MNLDREIGFTWSPLKVPVLLMILSISSEKLSLFSRFFLIMILDIINVPLCFSVRVIFSFSIQSKGKIFVKPTFLLKNCLES